MATLTPNYYIGPEDGWVQIATDSSYLRVEGFPCNHGFYIYISDTAPNNAIQDPTGTKIDGEKLVINQPFQGTVYARVMTPVNGQASGNQKLRLDVITVPYA